MGLKRRQGDGDGVVILPADTVMGMGPKLGFFGAPGLAVLVPPPPLSLPWLVERVL